MKSQYRVCQIFLNQMNLIHSMGDFHQPKPCQGEGSARSLKSSLFRYFIVNYFYTSGVFQEITVFRLRHVAEIPNNGHHLLKLPVAPPQRIVKYQIPQYRTPPVG